MLQVTFAEVVRVLEGLGSSVPAPEAHGCLCGALCTTAHYSMERWLEEIIPDEERRGDDDSQQTLRLLYVDTLNAMRGDEMTLEVLLPDDDVPLATRAGGLSQWCQGFLYGFGTGQPVDAASLPENVDEILRDLTHIGRATVALEADEGDNNEEEEEAYTEVVEYVRVGVQLIHDELMAVRGTPVADADEEGPAPSDDEADDEDPDILH